MFLVSRVQYGGSSPWCDSVYLQKLTDLMLTWNDHPNLFELSVQMDLPDPSAGEAQLNDAQLMQLDVVKVSVFEYLYSQ